MKKVLISGYIGFNNFGDEGIFYALLEHLKEKNIDIRALCANGKKYDIKTYNYKNPISILSAISNCDILISGGGSLLQNKTSSFSLYYYLLIIFFAKLFFKKVIIFSQGIEPIKGIFDRNLTKFILKLTDYIMVRDKKSKLYLEGMKIKSDLNNDAVYSILEKIPPKENKKGLLVQLRSFRGMDENLLINLADCIKKHYKEEITLLALQKEEDEKICKNFIEKLKNYDIEAKYFENNEIKDTFDIINSAKYMISARLHGLITSKELNTKTFALCYDDKIKTFCEETNTENIDIMNYSKDELDKKLDSFFNNQIHEVHSKRIFNWENFDSVIEKF